MYFGKLGRLKTSPSNDKRNLIQKRRTAPSLHYICTADPYRISTKHDFFYIFYDFVVLAAMSASFTALEFHFLSFFSRFSHGPQLPRLEYLPRFAPFEWNSCSAFTFRRCYTSCIRLPGHQFLR